MKKKIKKNIITYIKYSKSHAMRYNIYIVNANNKKK